MFLELIDMYYQRQHKPLPILSPSCVYLPSYKIPGIKAINSSVIYTSLLSIPFPEAQKLLRHYLVFASLGNESKHGKFLLLQRSFNCSIIRSWELWICCQEKRVFCIAKRKVLLYSLWIRNDLKKRLKSEMRNNSDTVYMNLWNSCIPLTYFNFSIFLKDNISIRWS